MDWSIGAALVVALYFLAGLRIVRSPNRGLVERFGHFRRLVLPGIHWIVPGVERLFLVNVTEVSLSSDRK
jgi:regulator of protease activity HflC (stomatin/prohibitin superfamily)